MRGVVRDPPTHPTREANAFHAVPSSFSPRTLFILLSMSRSTRRRSTLSKAAKHTHPLNSPSLQPSPHVYIAYIIRIYVSTFSYKFQPYINCVYILREAKSNIVSVYTTAVWMMLCFLCKVTRIFRYEISRTVQATLCVCISRIYGSKGYER